ncbi:hypothetical protein [Pseudogracilibacillus sp. SO30301A]|uniref:hypothetical protein n=1 Tax=Pseudogracilibacillus sp. SO30301A TaxID=3098291 RepID=UPI00300E5A1A
MSLRKYRRLAIFAIIINLISIYTALFAVWSAILLVFSIFIINNKESSKRLIDKKIMGFIQTFMLAVFTLIFTVFGVSLFPIMHHVVDAYIPGFYYLFIVLGIIGLISFYYLFIKLFIEAIQVLKMKEI